MQDWGGPIGLLAAQQTPDIFKSFVILNTALGAPQLPLNLSFFHRFSLMAIIPEIVFFCFKYPLFILDKVQFDQTTIKGEVARAYSYPIRGIKRLSALWYARMVPDSEDHSSFKLLKKLGEFIQTLENVQILWGAKDPILGQTIFRNENKFKKATIKKLEAGHFLQEEVYKDIASAIRSYPAPTTQLR